MTVDIKSAGGFTVAVAPAAGGSTNPFAEGAARDEIHALMTELTEALGAAGHRLTEVVKAVCVLTDDSHRGVFWQAWSELMPAGTHPVRITHTGPLPAGRRFQLEFVAAR